MAKLKAPLFSLGASGQLGKALVFFPWKGVNAVRTYVVPANPKTTGQTTQRGYLTDAVADIHAYQARIANPLDEDDVRAYALWGSTYATPRTWFNQCVKNYVDQKVAGLREAIFVSGSTTPTTEQLVFKIYSGSIIAGKLTEGNFWYGTSRTALINKVAGVPDLAGHHMTATVTPLTTGVKYFWQFRPTLLVGYLGARSGIYYGTPT